MTTPHLGRFAWFIDCTVAPPPGRRWPTQAAPAQCATVAEGVAEATRALLVLAACPVDREGRPAPVEGRVACPSCGSILARFHPDAPAAWAFVGGDAACGTCVKARQELGIEGRRAPRRAAGACGAARQALGAWCRRLIHAGGVERVELGAELGADGTSLAVSLRIVASGPDSRVAWTVSATAADLHVEETHPPEDAGSSVASWRAWEALDARVEAFVRELDALEVRHAGPHVEVNCTLQGRDLLVIACAVDEVIAWDAMGGPFYADAPRQRI